MITYRKRKVLKRSKAKIVVENLEASRKTVFHKKRKKVYLSHLFYRNLGLNPDVNTGSENEQNTRIRAQRDLCNLPSPAVDSRGFPPWSGGGGGATLLR